MKTAISLTALGLALALSTPLAAQQLNPEGSWLIESGESQFEVSLCGDGTELCATLVWVDPAAEEDSYGAYLGQSVAAQLTPTGPGEWQGTVVLDGREVSGTVTQVAADALEVRGCVGMVCDTVQLIRV